MLHFVRCTHSLQRRCHSLYWTWPGTQPRRCTRVQWQTSHSNNILQSLAMILILLICISCARYTYFVATNEYLVHTLYLFCDHKLVLCGHKLVFHAQIIAIFWPQLNFFWPCHQTILDHSGNTMLVLGLTYSLIGRTVVVHTWFRRYAIQISVHFKNLIS